jgi:formate dehydrogenase major subunit
MAITRRDFLKSTAVAGAALYLGIFNFEPVKAYADANPPVWQKETTSICCFCGVGCGVIVGTPLDQSTVTYVQGDPEHPINKGSLCSKGSSLAQLRTVDGALNTKRLTLPKYRAAGATTWETKTWDWTLNTIRDRIRTTRAAHTVTEELIDSVLTPVNRCTGIANLGGAALDNEECYLLSKLMRSLGVVYLEHQARI